MRKSFVALTMGLFLLSACAHSTSGPGSGAAEGIVKGQVDQVNQNARQVFNDLKIQQTGSTIKNSGNERELTGKMGDSDVVVQMDNNPNATTRVKVSASKNAFSGDKNLAETVLDRIVAAS